MNCTCGHVEDEHGQDPDYPGSSSCNIEGCDCVAFEGDGEDEGLTGRCPTCKLWFERDASPSPADEAEGLRACPFCGSAAWNRRRA